MNPEGITLSSSTAAVPPLRVFDSFESFQRFARESTRQWESRSTGGGGTKSATAAASPPCLYVYQNGVYDVTPFVGYHPGGADTLYAYHGEDITHSFDSDGHEHTVAARNMLLQYKIGVIQSTTVEETSSSDAAQSNVDASNRDSHTPYPRILPDRIEYRDFTILRNRGLIWQTMALTKEQYDHCISTPIFLPTCRLFDRDALEALTSTPYWVAPLLWLPLAVFWLMRGVLMDHRTTSWQGRFDPSGAGLEEATAAKTTATAWMGSRMAAAAAAGGGGGQGVLDRYLYYPNNIWGFNYGSGAARGGRVGVGDRQAMCENHASIGAAAKVDGHQHNLSAKGSLCDVAALSQALPEQLLSAARLESGFHPMYVVMWFLCGILTWTLLEYFLHRVVFHFERVVPDVLMDHPYTRFLHMIIHGIHHIIPMDAGRLIFPPVLFVMVCSTIHALLSLVMAGSTLDVFVAAMTIGYLCYDMTHYSVHQRELRWCAYYRDLKQYHSAHHFVNDRRGYGVSNKLWDYVFGTQLLKKNGAYYTTREKKVK